jgi:hypothetical protein
LIPEFKLKKKKKKYMQKCNSRGYFCGAPENKKEFTVFRVPRKGMQ